MALGLKKAYKIYLFQKFKTQNLHFHGGLRTEKSLMIYKNIFNWLGVVKRFFN